jgi:ubiquinone/menaquinone biosynthesis C-methylase UbiE
MGLSPIQLEVDQALTSLRLQARNTWAAGDYDAVAEGIWEVGERIVNRIGVGPGDRVLDVAAGTGNAAIRAAQKGARVTGIDITPELFDAARRRSREAGVEVEWVAGDAEALPFADASFGVVLSTFGVMFAPRHQMAADEMVRVLRPGGRLGMCSWTAEGTVGEFFRVMERHLPPPPPIAQPPLLWGDEEHVRQLFEGAVVELTIERDQLEIDPDVNVDEALEFYLASFGPLVKAREALEPVGRWRALVDDVSPQIRRMATEAAEYLIVTGTRRPG